MVSQTELRGALRRFWGYDSFRPLQEKVVRSLIAGHDTCAVMPTGFGKSLCYQLPAAMLSNETVVVVSPLIALMQDQVAQLTQMGIPSALLNSSLTKPRQAQVISGSHGGKVSPAVSFSRTARRCGHFSMAAARARLVFRH